MSELELDSSSELDQQSTEPTSTKKSFLDKIKDALRPTGVNIDPANKGKNMDVSSVEEYYKETDPNRAPTDVFSNEHGETQEEITERADNIINAKPFEEVTPDDSDDSSESISEE